jgi:hypothetical protein
MTSIRHLAFMLFARLLGGLRTKAAVRSEPMSQGAMDLKEIETMSPDPEAPRLVTPEVDALLGLAGVDRISDAASRTLVVAAMKSFVTKVLGREPGPWGAALRALDE